MLMAHSLGIIDAKFCLAEGKKMVGQ